ncbi:RhoGAP-domain-containing protein [Auriscalpium vulgare]|uniref:RhoGAP-domain-containing protein n=1 Tax=Auriscalpium vulgare TaxID=40419 RepID=A0ACB8RKA3_9AGAM|nr:RhoGAP-domain-containing protein [Auriscalpium vulgare]
MSTGSNADLGEPSSPAENKLCPGCQLTVMNENGGVVIAFGSSFFHVDCFKCAKCHDKVTADTNLLLLSDGQPVCSNCSYSCSVCRLPILDEAIMTGDDSYHAHCFKCRSCQNRIDELMFAKTSHGIYCMNCHHQRVARSKRHAQKQAERDKAAGGSGSSKSRDRMAKEHNGPPPVNQRSLSASSSNPPSRDGTAPALTQRANTLPLAQETNPPSSAPQTRRGSMQDENVNGARPASPQVPLSQSVLTPHRRSRNGVSTPTTPLMTVASPEPLASSSRPSSPAVVIPPAGRDADASSLVYLNPSSSTEASNAQLLLPDPNAKTLSKRKSYDDGVRPLNILLAKSGAPSSDASPTGLNVPSKGGRAGKRNSINPGMSFDLNAVAAEIAKGPESTPHSPNHATATSAPGRSSPLGADLRVSDLSRKPSRNGFVGSPPAMAHASSSSSSQSDLPPAPGSRSRAESSPKPAMVSEPARPPLRPSITLERVPPRTHSLTHPISQDILSSSGRSSPAPSGARPRPSVDERPPRGLASSLSIDVEKSRGLNKSRSASPAAQVASPAHRVDVPHGVESGTDTDEGDSAGHRSVDASVDGHEQPPALPPKEEKTRSRPEMLHLDIKVDESVEEADVSWSGSVADLESGESSPVERVSHSTFIAPALPPIRFSMNNGDFADLLKSVNGRASMPPGNRASVTSSSLEKVAEDTPPTTPPYVRNSDDWQSLPTPTSSASATTFTMSSESIPDDSSVTTVDATSAPSSSGHSDGHAYSQSKGDDRPPGTPSTIVPLERQRSAVNGTVPTDDTRDAPHFPTVAGRSSSGHGHGHGSRGGYSRDGHSPPAQRQRFDSTTSYNGDTSISYESSAARITVTAPGSSVARPHKFDKSDLIIRRLQEALQEASGRGSMHVNLDSEFVQAILMVVEQRKVENAEMKGKLDTIKRASQQVMDGLTVAQGEYEAELNARRDAEAEVTRLRVLLNGQAARITAMSAPARKEELHKRLTRELSDNLSVLEQDVSKLKVERDVTLAEVEELASTKSSPDLTNESNGVALSRSFTTRLDKLKSQYRRDLLPLTEERESLLREIAELKAARDVFLEETTMLNSRNEELAQLSALYMRRTEAAAAANDREKVRSAPEKSAPEKSAPSPPAVLQPSSTVLTNSSMSTEDSADSSKYVKVSKPVEVMETPGTLRKKFPWRGGNKEVTPIAISLQENNNEKGRGGKHTFQQLSVLRFTRCDHCGDKLFGSQVRCTACNISVHVRCQGHVLASCSPQVMEPPPPSGPPPPSMFGRDLTDQVRSDSKNRDRMVPAIVEKCIDAVDSIALDYEGIYRKTGGSGQSKTITQLFERGDYDAFDLRDSDRFNDICSVTSVLKTYFRSLPNPLLTYALHDEFMHASALTDPMHKSTKYADLVKQLPTEHYYTLRMLMLHLHRVHLQSAQNLMTARNLGVVFGPTLMRSRNPGAEFSDMAGKALSIEFLVENAADIFPPLPSPQ